MNIIKKNMSIKGTEYRGCHNVDNGSTVPIYEVLTTQGLTQIIGHVKFNNKNANVFYRGECRLHKTLIPSMFRDVKRTATRIRSLNKLVHRIESDELLSNDLKLDGVKYKEHIVEGMLQHYGIRTRYIDMIDNHWVALWMGHYRNTQSSIINTYYHYERREMPYSEMLIDGCTNDEDLYQYILMVGTNQPDDEECDGVSVADNNIVIDLRKALPSIFLRPHAQHGIVARKRGVDQNNPAFYDFADQVLCILKIRIDRVEQWLGNGELLTQANFFPSPMYDQGYDTLLSREAIFKEKSQDIFKEKSQKIAKYL